MTEQGQANTLGNASRWINKEKHIEFEQHRDGDKDCADNEEVATKTLVQLPSVQVET